MGGRAELRTLSVVAARQERQVDSSRSRPVLAARAPADVDGARGQHTRGSWLSGIRETERGERPAALIISRRQARSVKSIPRPPPSRLAAETCTPAALFGAPRAGHVLRPGARPPPEQGSRSADSGTETNAATDQGRQHAGDGRCVRW